MWGEQYTLFSILRFRAQQHAVGFYTSYQARFEIAQHHHLLIE
ncbi:Uncharacterised protein [Vibrio cholerae]|nr:Uncharacterised protein [Vibrio cholerae]